MLKKEKTVQRNNLDIKGISLNIYIMRFTWLLFFYNCLISFVNYMATL